MQEHPGRDEQVPAPVGVPDWRQVEALFERAMELEAPARANFLAEACSDAALRREVESLLEHAGQKTQTVGIAALAAAYADSTDPDGQRIGERMGPYRIEGIAGHGGMGAVYLAVRDDEQFRQRVAIKLVRAAVASPSILNRFRRERQILARLEHSYIARLTDGGITADGLPFLAMEYVDGLPLTRYCTDHALGLKARLQLFRKVCEAVEYAHRNLVVHRDLKPANILVTADGTPKLLDFGIATLLAADNEETPALTMTFAQVMTPAYASPEQVRGEPVSTSSDVYSLGAVLYELLSGARPHHITGTTPLEIIHAVCDTVLERPSTVAAAGARRQLEGDLDNIVLKAMHKEPARRYHSVESFSEDIRRYLDGLPVLARPDTLRYRAGKFIRRNKWQIAAVALIILSLSGGLVVSLAAQQRANRRFQQVRQLANRFLFDFHDEIINTPGTVKAREMIVSTALQYLNSLSRDADGDPGLQWEMAVAYGKVATAQGSEQRPSLGRPRDALVSYDKALALARPLDDRRFLNDKQRESLANFLCDDAGIRRYLKEYDAAAALQREAVARGGGLRPFVQSRSMGELGLTLGMAGQWTESLAAIERVLKVSQEMARREPTFSNRLRVAASWYNLARPQVELTMFDEAEKSAREALAQLHVLKAERPTDARMLQGFFVALSDLGGIEGSGEGPSLGKYREGAAYLEEAIALMDTVIAADPKDSNTRTEKGSVESSIAWALCENTPRKALAAATEAARLLDAYAPDDTESRVSPRLAGANAHRVLGEFADAERLLKEADRILTVRGAETEADLNLARARLEAARGDRAAAAARFDHALALYEQALKKMPTPARAWALTRTLEFAAAAVPEQAAARRQRVIEVWMDQNRRWPGHSWIEQRLAAATAGGPPRSAR